MNATDAGTGVTAALRVVQAAGVVRPRDFSQRGLDPKYLHRLYKRGLVERVGRGLYVAAGAEPSEHHSLAEAAKRVPAGTVCLLSALRFHEIGTQNPFEIWLTLGVHARTPHVPDLPLRIVRASGEALGAGIESHDVESVTVRVYSLAKTVADCFKYRNKIGLDVALEALKDTWLQRRTTMDELLRFAGLCRVETVMRPYLEVVAA